MWAKSGGACCLTHSPGVGSGGEVASSHLVPEELLVDVRRDFFVPDK